MTGWPNPPHPRSDPTCPAVSRPAGAGPADRPRRHGQPRGGAQAKPDLILDFGSVRDTYVSLADNVQEQTKIPYVLIDGRFEARRRRCACWAISSA